jgi:hypothetical protein
MPGKIGLTNGPTKANKENASPPSVADVPHSYSRAKQRKDAFEDRKSEKVLIKNSIITEKLEEGNNITKYSIKLQARNDRIAELKMLVDYEDSPESKKICIRNLKDYIKSEPIPAMIENEKEKEETNNLADRIDYNTTMSNKKPASRVKLPRQISTG